MTISSALRLPQAPMKYRGTTESRYLTRTFAIPAGASKTNLRTFAGRRIA
jgi:hypothetical protein